jgi:uncharacterized DUF497 family protein
MVDIRWSEEKKAKLKAERGVSFQEAAALILQGNHFPVRVPRSDQEQDVFLVSIRGYTYVVPYVTGTDGSLFLKTMFPSRKYHRKYGAQIT